MATVHEEVVVCEPVPGRVPGTSSSPVVCEPVPGRVPGYPNLLVLSMAYGLISYEPNKEGRSHLIEWKESDDAANRSEAINGIIPLKADLTASLDFNIFMVLIGS
ncbi:hypothetical protein LINGRAHAP2_LOCUS4580 [Linum grandiflorum]